MAHLVDLDLKSFFVGTAVALLVCASIFGAIKFSSRNPAPTPEDHSQHLTPVPSVTASAAHKVTVGSACWPQAGSDFAGTLAGQPAAIWCQGDLANGSLTAVIGPNSWLDEFNHGLTLGKFDTVNYVDFPIIGSAYKSQLWRHANHWMRDFSGVDSDGAPPWDFAAAAMRPNATFKAENGQLTIEVDVATRVSSYGDNSFWPEVVITTGDRPSDIRKDGTYVYEAFPNHWTLGCRLQNDGGFTCALLDNTAGGDDTARVFELSHFQCGNASSSRYYSNYQCHSIYGGLPSNLPDSTAAHSRDCAALDPDTNCRDRWRWEITNNRLTWYANGIKYMEHTDFEPGAKAALDALLSKPLYVYFGEFTYKLGVPGRMHWDRIVINPKDANGTLQGPSHSESFCLGAPNNTCPAGASMPNHPGMSTP